MQLSPDGRWFWDGARWRPAYSPDGSWRWDGRQWVPAVAIGPQRWRYEPTEWTRRVQLVLLALTAVGLVFALAFVPTVFASVMQQSIDRAIAQQASTSNVDPAQLREAMHGFLTAVLVVTATVTVAWLAVVVTGVIRLWRWVYWYFAVSYLLALIGIPQNVAYLAGYGPYRLPAWLLLFGIFEALVGAAVGVWMIVLYRRYGTWARRRVPA